MTKQDLTNSKKEIIIRINEIADNSKMSEIMTSMLNLVNGGMNDADNAIDLVDEVVELYGYQKKETVSLKVNGVEYDNLSDYNHANNRAMWNKR